MQDVCKLHPCVIPQTRPALYSRHSTDMPRWEARNRGPQFNRPRAAPLLFEAFLDRFSGLAAFCGTLSFQEDGGCPRRDA